MQGGIPLEVIAAQGHVHALRGEIHRAARRVQMHLHAGMPPLEFGQPWNQPHHGDGGFAGQHQRRIRRRRPQGRQTRRELLEQAARDAQQLPAGTGQENRPVPSFEECHAQRLLQQPDLPADRAMRDMQLLRGLAERLVARGGVEHAQGVQGREFHGYW
ncbi:hypothetical protein D3C85_1463150 [compost metagenome]